MVILREPGKGTAVGRQALALHVLVCVEVVMMSGTCCALDSAFYLEQGKRQEQNPTHPKASLLGTADGLCVTYRLRVSSLA